MLLILKKYNLTSSLLHFKFLLDNQYVETFL